SAAISRAQVSHWGTLKNWAFAGLPTACRSLIPVPRSLQRTPDLLRRVGDLPDPDAGRVVDGAGKGRGDAVFRDLGDGFGAERAARLDRLHEDDVHLRHLVGAVDLVGAEGGVEQIALGVVN